MTSKRLKIFARRARPIGVPGEQAHRSLPIARYAYNLLICGSVLRLCPVQPRVFDHAKPCFECSVSNSVGHSTATLVGETWPPRLCCVIPTSIFTCNWYLVEAYACASFHTSFHFSFPLSPSVDCLLSDSTWNAAASDITVCQRLSRFSFPRRRCNSESLSQLLHITKHCVGARRLNGTRHRTETRHNCGE
jgi:hypothetical protein